MEHNYASPIVIKYGGNAMTRDRGADPVLESAVGLHRNGTPVVLVHGGGPEIDRWLADRNVPTRRVDGLRVTDEETLEVTEAVLCATINKRLVRACTAHGACAVGISGEDGATLVARRAFGSKGEDLGYVGEVTHCDPTLINLLLAGGFFPIVSPLAISEDRLHAFNINADLSAAALAGALEAKAFLMITDVARVRRDPSDSSSGIDRMSLAEARVFMQSPACEGGMKPKMQAAIAAVEAGARASHISAQQPVADILAGNATVVSP